MNRKALILVTLCLSFAGAQAAWVKDGASAEDLKRDQSACERKARADTSFNSPQPARRAGAMSGQGASNTMVKENNSFRLCMKSLGYADPTDK